MQKLAVRFGTDSVRPMLERMNPGDWVIDIAAFPGGEIGVVHAPGERSSALANTGAGPGLWRLENGDIIAWSGLPLAEGKTVPRVAANVLPELAARLDGVFAAIGWSQEDGRLYIVTDFLGLQPVYVGDHSGDWAAATEIKPFPYDPDPAGWGAFLAFGHTIGNVTLTTRAERLRPATILTVTPPDARGAPPRIKTSRYWEMPDEGQEPPPEATVAALKANTAAYQALAGPNVCLLSGGFDSRLILSLLHRMGVEERRAFILSHHDQDADMDGRLAARVAKRSNTPCEYYTQNREFYSTKEYLDYVWAIDGATPNLHLFIAQLAPTLNGHGSIWEGLIPAVALRAPMQSGDGGFETMRRERVHINRTSIKIFKPAVQKAMLDGFEAEFERTKALYPQTPHGVWQWVIEQRVRNRSGINPTKVYPNHATPLMVGSSRQLWELIAPIGYERRKHYDYYIDVFRALAPEMAQIPFYSTGGSLHRADTDWATYKAYELGLKTWRAVNKRPLLARACGIHRKFGFIPSRFTRHPVIFREEDDLLDMDFVRRAETEEPLRFECGKLLFHWRAARWVHENRLHATLLPG
ncbi:asparagine synthase-related protein [Pedomonas mirosovicensis]|uniref:asparagine synthase-related protein n=1 Tax=Pedomonas mirosovicensis TaxID=2908641 RepID=UPI002167B0E0|nr:asparagine synthase-related protein [Pedomonas mirosovicensis]MCH8683957.1 asparagine synthase-related protein [Pedomonas mirosovicensis]